MLDPSKPWPPPDPDRMFRAVRRHIAGNGFTHSMDVDAFRQRQLLDLARYEDADGEYVVRRRPFHERLEALSKPQRDAYDDNDNVIVIDDDDEVEREEAQSSQKRDDDGGEEAWRNKEGERLADFGVDEVAEFFDEDDLPLSELMRRRQVGHE